MPLQLEEVHQRYGSVHLQDVRGTLLRRLGAPREPVQVQGARTYSEKDDRDEMNRPYSS